MKKMGFKMPIYGIFSQKFSNFEVLLVDNNSNDGAIGLVKKIFQSKNIKI